jgi:hypothetical protein
MRYRGVQRISISAKNVVSDSEPPPAGTTWNTAGSGTFTLTGFDSTGAASVVLLNAVTAVVAITNGLLVGSYNLDASTAFTGSVPLPAGRYEGLLTFSGTPVVGSAETFQAVWELVVE